MRMKTSPIWKPTPVPSSFYGWYTQAAYQLWKTADYTLTPFVRYEQFNTANSFSPVPAGLEVATGPNEKVTTVGANFKIGEGVVLKADYQKFKEDKTRDSLKAALALHFAYYNFCRKHSTIRATPAMAAGIADRAWTLRELLA